MTIFDPVWGLLFVAVSMALVAGIFLSFSDFIMRSLAVSTSTTGIEAMQNINREVYRSIFMVLFLGLVPVTLGVAAVAVIASLSSVVPWIMTGSVLYVLGVFGVTAAGNVPKNKTLDALPADGPEARRYWQVYVPGWSRWNHIRTFCATLAALCYMIAAIQLAAT